MIAKAEESTYYIVGVKTGEAKARLFKRTVKRNGSTGSLNVPLPEIFSDKQHEFDAMTYPLRESNMLQVLEEAKERISVRRIALDDVYGFNNQRHEFDFISLYPIYNRKDFDRLRQEYSLFISGCELYNLEYCFRQEKKTSMQEETRACGFMWVEPV